MKGILSFVKTNFNKIPAMKFNGIHEASNQYNGGDSITAFKGNMDISDGVIAFSQPISRESVIQDMQAEVLMENDSSSLVEETMACTDSTTTDSSHDDDYLGIITIENSSAFKISYNERNTNEISVNGVFDDTIINSSQDIMNRIDSIKDVLGIENPSVELVLGMENETDTGKTYLYKQLYKNIEVLGYNIRISMDYDANQLTVESCLMLSEALNKNILTIIPKLSEKETSDWIRTLYPEATKIISSLIIYPDRYGSSPKLAYLSYLYNQNDRSRRQQIVTDANSGEIIYEDDMSF